MKETALAFAIEIEEAEPFFPEAALLPLSLEGDVLTHSAAILAAKSKSVLIFVTC